MFEKIIRILLPLPNDHIVLPNVVIEVCHSIRTIFVYIDNPEVTDESFKDFRLYLKRKNLDYFVQIFTPTPKG